MAVTSKHFKNTIRTIESLEQSGEYLNDAMEARDLLAHVEGLADSLESLIELLEEEV